MDADVDFGWEIANHAEGMGEGAESANHLAAEARGRIVAKAELRPARRGLRGEDAGWASYD